MNKEEIKRIYTEIMGPGDMIDFDSEEVANLTQEDIEYRKELVLDLIRKARRVGHPQNHVLSAIGQTMHTPYVGAYAMKSFLMYQEAIAKTEEKTVEICEKMGIEYPLTLKDFVRIYAVCTAASDGKNLPEIWLLNDNFFEFTDDLKRYLDLRSNSVDIEDDLFEDWTVDIEEIDADGILASWEELKEKSIVIKKMKLAVILKKLSPYSKSGVKEDNAYEALLKVSKLQKNKEEMLKIKEAYQELLPSSFRLSRNDLEVFYESYEIMKNICEIIEKAQAEDYFMLLTRENLPLWRSGAPVWKRFCELRSGIHKALMISPSKIMFVKDFLTTEMNFCEVCKDRLDMFHNWIEWNAAKKKAIQNGLGKVCEAYENGMIHSAVFDAYEKGLYKALYEIYC